MTIAAANQCPDHALDAGLFRHGLGHYPTGVAVITAQTIDRPVGLTVGSFTSVSLAPPLVGFFPNSNSTTWPKIERTGRFCVNVLAADQENVCRAFASKGPDRFEAIGHRPSSNGSPIIEGAIVWIDCDLDSVAEAGDHLIVIGRVRELQVERSCPPLLFYRGSYGRFAMEQPF